MTDYFEKYEGLLSGLFVFAIVAGVFGLYSSKPSVQGYAVANLNASAVTSFAGFIISFAVFLLVVLVLIVKNNKENKE